MKIGDIVNAKVTNILGYGAFVSVDEYDGLIHISEFSDYFVRDIHEYVHIGDEIRLKVLEIDEEHKHIKLSYKQINKKRGIRCRIPQYEIGFEPFKTNLNNWIDTAQKRDSFIDDDQTLDH